MPSGRRLSRLVPCCSFCFLVASTAPHVCGQSTNFTLTSTQTLKDAFTTSAHPGNNYGGAGAIAVSAAGSSKGQFDSVIEFDPTDAFNYFNTVYGANHWDVVNIQLSLTVMAPMNSIFNANADGTVNVSYFTTDTWNEGNGTPMLNDTNPADVNYNNLAALVADQHLLASEAETTSVSPHIFTLSLYAPLVYEIKNGTPLSFHLDASSGSFVYNSRSFTTPSARPSLLITAQAAAVPEPSSVVFALTASAASWFGYRRRRRAAAAAEAGVE
jgi:hypothetical protein